MSYGDFFAAGVVGDPCGRATFPAVLCTVMLVAALCWDQLFRLYDVLPATVRPRALIAAEVGTADGR